MVSKYLPRRMLIRPGASHDACTFGKGGTARNYHLFNSLCIGVVFFVAINLVSKPPSIIYNAFEGVTILETQGYGRMDLDGRSHGGWYSHQKLMVNPTVFKTIINTPVSWGVSDSV